MKERPRLLIFCNRYLGFTLLNSGGLISALSQSFEIMILVDETSLHSVELTTKGNCKVRTFSPKFNRLTREWMRVLGDIMVMTYAQAKGRKNQTGVLHRKSHLAKSKKRGLLYFLRKSLIVKIAEHAERNKYARRGLQWLFFHLSPKEEFIKLMEDFRPNLCLATTAGLHQDGIFFAAARKCAIKSVSAIQSWDRTASKGYPAHHPDFCIVWNEAMKREAIDFLEFDEEQITVSGAPVWDKYLSQNAPLDPGQKEKFLKKWGMKHTKKTVFVALNGPATHLENQNLIDAIALALKTKQLTNTQVMFRVHPSYLTLPDRICELSDKFNSLKQNDMHLMTPIVREPNNKDYVVTAEDREFMHSMFRACDCTVAIVSTWMIESSIFDKPNVCVRFGRWKTELYDFDLSEYKAEHIERVLAYNAVFIATSQEELIAHIKFALKNASIKNQQRKELVQIECGPNQGRAKALTARAITNFL